MEVNDKTLIFLPFIVSYLFFTHFYKVLLKFCPIDMRFFFDKLA